MGDDSPGKVQALRAIFSEKNTPVMGLMPPGSKVAGRPWHSLDSTNQEPTLLKEKKFSELRLGNKVLPVNEKSPTSFNGDYGDKQNRTVSKPAVGPKPSHLVQQHKITSSESSNSNSSAYRPTSLPSSEAKSKAFGETIASFMFSGNKENESVSSNSRTSAPPLPSVPKPKIAEMQNRVDVLNFSNSQNSTELDSQCCNLISSDNYICKVRRKELPSKEKLGPAPLKPIKPAHMALPMNCSSTVPPPQVPAPVQRPPSLQRPTYPCPPRPLTPPPLPPILAPVIKPPPTCLREEIEELYEDTLLLGENKRPVSLIPEYTEEEEQAELYHDAADGFEENSSFSDSSLKYKKPPPPVPSEYLQPNINGSTEELYQDADGTTQEEFYEVMPCDEIPEDSGSPLYSNNKREIEKLKKEEEKRIRREQKEKEKREKELEKLRRKFGLTGEEIPIDDGLVKWDSRGGRGDLPVKKGETVLILRMEGNPSGRWLVKNEKGKIGYVELTNIEVDPLSVKSVMSIRRLSAISAGEELYCEAKSEEEAIYEVTY